MKSEKDYRLYFYCLAFLVILIILLQFDFELARAITSLRFDALNSMMIVLSATVLQIALAAAASLIVYLNQKKKLLHLWLSYAVTLAISYILKIIIARPRPFEAGISTFESLIKESYSKFDFSLPSNHAALAFVPLLFLPKKYRIPWLVLACLIALSRVYLGLHYLSDVLSGAALGVFVSYLIINKVKI
jgi:membrane-associated phospholipid phosphatase